MLTLTERKKAFAIIDKDDDSGMIEFKEWYKHFDASVRNSTMTAEKLLELYRGYDKKGSRKGLNF